MIMYMDVPPGILAVQTCRVKCSGGLLSSDRHWFKGLEM